MNKIIIIFSFLLVFSGVVRGDEDGLSIVAVGDATVLKEKILLIRNPTNNLSGATKKLAKEIFNLLKNDFSFYLTKFLVTEKKGAKKNIFGKLDFSSNFLKKINYVILFETNTIKGKYSSLEIKVRMYRVSEKKEIFNQKLIFSIGTQRKVGHKLADEMYKVITGKRSVFTSFFVFVSNVRSPKGKSLKELYKMDFDGKNKVRLTFHKGNVISPSISYDNKYVLYSLVDDKVSKYRKVKLYIYNMLTKRHKLLSSRKGINSGAIFMPDNKEIALTLSHTGNAEIYIMNLKTRAMRRVTKHYSIDVDPSVSKDGKIMVFLSGRKGSAHIHMLDPRGTEKNVKRISFVGEFNASPRFSPDGKRIAFSSWIDGRFDIFRIDANRTNLVRLTKKFGSNEEPTWSNDSHFIAFASQRVITQKKAVQNIYIMNLEGEIIGAVTQNFGNSTSPRWSK